MSDIKVFDPRTKSEIIEKVYGGALLRFAYENKVLRTLISSPIIQKPISKIFGELKKSSSSAKQVHSFIKEYNIQIEDFEVPENGFRTFNDFFIRKKKKITFPEGKTLGSPCDARLSLAKIQNGVPVLKIKDKEVPLPTLLGASKARCPQEGWALTFRLCPVDYHRYHFVDSGKTEETILLGTLLHSVNPWALEQEPQIFEWNERQLTVQQSENFGEIFYIEVGAMCVGCIHQTYESQSVVSRGQEKGYFDFGGSTQVLLLGKNFKPNEDILEASNRGLEYLVQVGDVLGVCQ